LATVFRETVFGLVNVRNLSREECRRVLLEVQDLANCLVRPEADGLFSAIRQYRIGCWRWGSDLRISRAGKEGLRLLVDALILLLGSCTLRRRLLWKSMESAFRLCVNALSCEVCFGNVLGH